LFGIAEINRELCHNELLKYVVGEMVKY